jgi:hypothetical protein
MEYTPTPIYNLPQIDVFINSMNTFMELPDRERAYVLLVDFMTWLQPEWFGIDRIEYSRHYGSIHVRTREMNRNRVRSSMLIGQTNPPRAPTLDDFDDLIIEDDT